MIIQCNKCKMYYNDEFRTTICDHNTFSANDGWNNFKHHSESYYSVNAPKEMTKLNLHGPESVPLIKNVSSLPLTVTIYDSKDNVIREEHIEYSDRQHRIWLGKVTVWAVQQGFVVETSKCKAGTVDRYF